MKQFTRSVFFALTLSFLATPSFSVHAEIDDVDLIAGPQGVQTPQRLSQLVKETDTLVSAHACPLLCIQDDSLMCSTGDNLCSACDDRDGVVLKFGRDTNRNRTLDPHEVEYQSVTCNGDEEVVQ